MYRNYDINWVKELLNYNIYIFGAGTIGRKVFTNAKLEGLKVVGFIDNDPSKKGKLIEDIPICSLSDVSNYRNEDWFIIIACNQIETIKSQLMTMGEYRFVDYTQIDFSGNGENYYNEDYFSWQLGMARIDSQIDVSFFQKYIDEKDSVCEFGCGGGLLLDKIKCKSKIGVDINPVARRHASTLSIKTFSSVKELPDESIDVAISTHALEHVLNPFEVLTDLRMKLKADGKIVFVVPYDSIYEEYEKWDVSHHVFTWNQRDLGNLFKIAGYFVKEVGIRESVWPDSYENIFEKVGVDTFKALAVLESARTANYSCYVYAEK